MMRAQPDLIRHMKLVCVERQIEEWGWSPGCQAQIEKGLMLNVRVRPHTQIARKRVQMTPKRSHNMVLGQFFFLFFFLQLRLEKVRAHTIKNPFIPLGTTFLHLRSGSESPTVTLGVCANRSHLGASKVVFYLPKFET